MRLKAINIFVILLICKSYLGQNVTNIDNILNQTIYENVVFSTACHPFGYFPIYPWEEIICNQNDYRLVFEDNFESDVVNQLFWRLDDNRGGMVDRQEYYKWENIEINDGILSLITKEEQLYANAGWQSDPNLIMPDLTPNYRLFNYTSGGLWTKFKLNRGYFEIRCKVPKGQGIWPAFWMFDSPGGQWQEIDCFEFMGNEPSNAQGENFQTNIRGVPAHDVESDVRNCPESFNIGVDFSENFHTYGFLWTQNMIYFFLDNQLLKSIPRWRTIQNQEVNFDCNQNIAFANYLHNIAFPYRPMHLIFNTQVRINEHGPNETTIFPKEFQIDWVRYWKNEPCEELILVNQDYELIEDGYNTVTANTVEIENFTLHEGEILVVTCEEAIVSSNFVQEEGSYFEVNIVDDINCNKSAQANQNGGDMSINELNIKRFDSNFYIQNLTNFAKVELTSNASIKLVKVYNQLGELLYFSNLKDSNTASVNYSTFPPGLYLVTIVDVNNKIHVQKFLIP